MSLDVFLEVVWWFSAVLFAGSVLVLVGVVGWIVRDVRRRSSAPKQATASPLQPVNVQELAGFLKSEYGITVDVRSPADQPYPPITQLSRGDRIRLVKLEPEQAV